MGLIYLGQDVTRRIYRDDLIPWREAPYFAVRVYICAALTPIVLWLGRRFPMDRETWARYLGLHLLFSGSFVLVEGLLAAALLSTLGVLSFALALQNEVAASLPILTIWNITNNLVAYWVILGIQSGVRYYRKFQEREQEALRLQLNASELQSQLVQARLSALKAQLQPHFLFNTLNAIVVLVRQRKISEAERTVERFSDLLRAVLTDIDAHQVPLSREIEHLQLYLSIEELRFSDRLRVLIEVDPDTLDAAVPHMSLQPIVENAVRHGIGNRAAGGSIEIRARAENAQLLISVSDDGPGLHSACFVKGRGLGLANTRARLLQLHGSAAELNIRAAPSGGTIVTMRLPYRFAASVTEADAPGDA